jgi:hypothetical protein
VLGTQNGVTTLIGSITLRGDVGGWQGLQLMDIRGYKVVGSRLYHALCNIRYSIEELVFYISFSYLLRPLNRDPQIQNTHGIGIIATVQNPSRLAVHPIPRPWYICSVKSGNVAVST